MESIQTYLKKLLDNLTLSLQSTNLMVNIRILCNYYGIYIQQNNLNEQTMQLPSIKELTDLQNFNVCINENENTTKFGDHNIWANRFIKERINRDAIALLNRIHQK